jgi:hypothetical protein
MAHLNLSILIHKGKSVKSLGFCPVNEEKASYKWPGFLSGRRRLIPGFQLHFFHNRVNILNFGLQLKETEECAS